MCVWLSKIPFLWISQDLGQWRHTHNAVFRNKESVGEREIERERKIVVQRGEVLDNSRTSDVVSPILLLAFFLYTHTHTTPPQPPPHTHHLHITYYTMTRPHTLETQTTQRRNNRKSSKTALPSSRIRNFLTKINNNQYQV